MKKRLLYVLFFLMMVVFSCENKREATNNPVSSLPETDNFSNQNLTDDTKTVIYSTNSIYPPYDWAVSDTDFDGASIELLKMVMPPDTLLKPVVYPWKRSMSQAQVGNIDLLVSLRITPERSEYLQFTTHRAFPNPIVAFVRKDMNITFNTWADLKPFHGGVSAGDTFGGGFDEYWKKELTIEEAPSMENNFQKLSLGRIDYFVTGYYAGMVYIGTHQLDNPIIALEPPISNMDIHFGFSKKSTKLWMVEYVSQRLAELDAQGIPEKLLIKYLENAEKNPLIYDPQ